MSSIKPIVLMILDGFGYREATPDNAIALAKTPHLDDYKQNHVYTLISGSGEEVGLPDGQMGNSEVGHTNIGAGRVVFQDLTRVDNAIKDDSFFENEVLVKAVTSVKNIHIMGLLSPGGVHSHEAQIEAMVELALKKGQGRVYVHAFLDGRDTPPRSASDSLLKCDARLKKSGRGYVASIVGRYYAMDRDNRWERVAEAYDLLAHGQSQYTASDAVTGLQDAYNRDENDEFVRATTLCPEGHSPVQIQDGDSVIFMNFRADRARELSHAFADEHFEHFDRGRKVHLSHFATLTEYESGLLSSVAYPPEHLQNVLGEVISNAGLRQLRIAETEKYAHVTFFFNGGLEAPFDGEDRLLIQSPDVATYDLKPQMSAPELTDKLVKAVESGQYDLIICNYANPDMVGHTGNLEATIQAIECLDECVHRVVEAVTASGGEALITADHGNAEQMFNEKTGQPHTAHTNLPVPLYYIGRHANVISDNGKLSDLAPTILSLMGESIPTEMTGKPLFHILPS